MEFDRKNTRVIILVGEYEIGIYYYRKWKHHKFNIIHFVDFLFYFLFQLSHQQRVEERQNTSGKM